MTLVTLFMGNSTKKLRTTHMRIILLSTMQIYHIVIRITNMHTVRENNFPLHCQKHSISILVLLMRHYL